MIHEREIYGRLRTSFDTASLLREGAVGSLFFLGRIRVVKSCHTWSDYDLLSLFERMSCKSVIKYNGTVFGNHATISVWN